MTSENCLAIFRDKVREHLHWQDAQEYLALLASYKKWKICDEMVNIRHNNGVGGYDADSPELNLFNPTISDFRGNILAYYNAAGGTNVWNAARPTGYGAVPGYRPVALAYSANVPQASAWRGHWPDITGYYHIGLRDLNPVTGGWMSSDSVWNERDPNWYTFAGGDPVMGFDADGRLATALGNFGVGVEQGFIQGSTGINTGQPIDTANYNGQATGRDLSVAVSAFMTAGGLTMTGAGAADMGLSVLATVAAGGLDLPVTAPALVAGTGVAALGVGVTAIGTYGIYNFMTIPPLQSPSNDSGGGGSSSPNSGSEPQAPPTEGNSPPSETPTQPSNDTSSWQQYEQQNGSQQTTLQTTFQGEQVTVRLDNLPVGSQIVDFKDYNWSNPTYENPFIQQQVIDSFQTQIEKYQTIAPNVNLQFSQQPPSWVVQAIQKVGGTYSVKP